MTLVSYAQNFEDVLLWRALRKLEKVFYIDVGAQHPRIDSVSKGLYEKGWRGIHIEPSPIYAAILREDRPDEVVIEAAVSTKSDRLDFYHINCTGLSTLDESLSRSAEAAGFRSEMIRVDTVSLDDILEMTSEEVNFMKIDVEGAEKDVIDSWNSSIRPWILVIESVMPGTTIDSSESWENKILSKGYIFAWFDGLNKFYVHHNHSDLIKTIAMPPNVFDDVTLSGESTSAFANHLTLRIKYLEEKMAQMS